MTAKRRLILMGIAAGALWAIAVLAFGWYALQGGRYQAGLAFGLALGGFIAGLPFLAMIARLAQRRFFDDSLIDGQPLTGAALIDQRVLANTAEQGLLAVAIWPLVGLKYGGGIVVALGIGFALSRLAFWIGYHISPPLRAFGFAATFYATIAAALWVLVGGLLSG